jgi:hypothetical protein
MPRRLDPLEPEAGITLAVALDVAGGGYLVELTTAELWPLRHAYSQTLIQLDEFESGRADEHLKALLAMHLKFLGFR